MYIYMSIIIYIYIYIWDPEQHILACVHTSM